MDEKIGVVNSKGPFPSSSQWVSGQQLAYWLF
jgi:hypothetical protein